MQQSFHAFHSISFPGIKYISALSKTIPHVWDFYVTDNYLQSMSLSKSDFKRWSWLCLLFFVHISLSRFTATSSRRCKKSQCTSFQCKLEENISPTDIEKHSWKKRLVFLKFRHAFLRLFKRRYSDFLLIGTQFFPYMCPCDCNELVETFSIAEIWHDLSNSEPCD